MKYFTKAQIEEIRRQLATLGVRDTDLQFASNMTGDELIAIIQDGINKKVGIKDFFIKYLPEDFVERLVQGKSAYEIAVENGFEGTPAEWLESLKGANGRDGTNGTNGTNGAAAGFGTPVASVDTTPSGQVGVSVSASGPNTAKIFNFVFHNLGSGSGPTPTPSGDARSVTGVDSWFKLTTDENVQSTPMSISDPSSSEGGSWSLTAGQTSVDYPYLRCFLQVNYDSALESGYTYTRSSAFTVQNYHGDASADYQELVDALANLRTELLADLANYDASLLALNTALENIRSQVSGNIANQLTELRNRLTQINNSEVGVIVDDPEGLWKVLTSYTDDTNGQKSFSDIVASAKTAKVTLQSGATFFDHTVGGSFTLDGLLGMIAARVTRQDVNALIASAEFSVDPSALNSVISKSQACWQKNDILFPYDLYLVDFLTDNPTATLADYETYMTSAPADDGPSGDGTDAHPAGPFTLVVVVEQFSNIKQTVDAISASVDTTKYMWQNGNTYASYDSFEDEYEARSATYESYTYEQYVHNVLGYDKVEVGAALSNVTQTSGEIKLQLGDVNYFWRRSAVGGGYEYAPFAVPSNKTRSQYISEQQTAGWSLQTYASRMGVVDMFPDSITSLVKNSALCWVNDSETGDAYCRDYDYFQNAYEESGSSLSYEEWMSINHSEYELTAATTAVSRIKQTADSVTSIVEDIGGIEDAFTALEQTTDTLSLAVTKSAKCWKSNSDGSLVGYENFRTEYNSAPRSVSYEAWVAMEKYHTLVDSFTEVSGIKIQGDKIWAAVGDGTDVKAAIQILAGLGTQDGKIVLSANKVIVDGDLFSQFISTNIDNDSYIEIDGGLIKFYDSDGNMRILMGQEDGDDTPVLKFFSASDDVNPLYDLGPNGIIRLGDIVYPPEFEAYNFVKFTTKPTVNSTYSTLVNTGSTTVTLYKYKDGERIHRVGQDSTLQYYNPVTKEWQNSHSALHDKYISGPTQTSPVMDGGFYVAPVYAWDDVTGSGYNTEALMLDTRNSTQFFGYLRLNVTTRRIDGVIKQVYSQDEAS